MAASRSSSTARGVSLNECLRLMQAELGDAAPARITLHRHSAAGMLNHLIVRKSDSRSYYDPKRMVEHYLNLKPSERAEIKVKRAHRGAAEVAGLDLEQVEKAAQLQAELIAQKLLPLIQPRLDAIFKTLEQQLPLIAHAAQNLDAVRQGLMLKYDQNATLLAQRAERAEAELRASRNGDDPIQRSLMKLSISISQLRDDVAALANPGG